MMIICKMNQQWKDKIAVVSQRQHNAHRAPHNLVEIGRRKSELSDKSKAIYDIKT